MKKSDRATSSDEFKERVRDATDLADLIGQSSKLSGQPRDLRGRCPLHNGENPTSLSVNAENGLWCCHVCDANGDCFSWVMAVDEVEFPDALHLLAARAGIGPGPDVRLVAPPEDQEQEADTCGPWTVSDYAAYVHLPIDWLRKQIGLVEWDRKWQQGVAIPYRDENGQLLRYRPRLNRKERRWGMLDEWHCPTCKRAQDAPGECGECGAELKRLADDPGGEVTYAYGRERLDERDGPLLIVEGETDAQVAWYCDLHALGAPGQTIFRPDWAMRFPEGTDQVFVLREDDGALPETVRDAVAEAGVPVTVRAFDLPTDDLLDLWRDVGGSRVRLREAMKEALADAQVVEPPPDEDPELAAFLDGKGRPVLPRIAEHLHSKAPVFAIRDRLYRYEVGVYRPDGEQRVRAELAELLGEAHSSYARREVLGYLRDRYPLIMDGGHNATDLIDPVPHVLNVGNGLLDVRDLSLRPHDPSYLSTLQVPHDFDPQAECPAVDRFLREVFPDDAVTLAYEFIGSLLRRDLNPEQVLLLIGDGSNGKSIFITILHALLGPDNCSAITVQQIDESRFHAINLMGKLANFCADLPATRLRETSTFKRAVSSDQIEGEWKGVQPITFTPFCKFVFACNTIPATCDHSDSFYRRWLPVEFLNTFVDPAKYDQKTSPPNHRPARDRTKLIAELTYSAELRGLMVRSLQAARAVSARGGRYSEPESVEQAQKRFRRETDTVMWFADERLFFDDVAKVSRQLVYDTYVRWADAQGVDAECQREFNSRLEGLGAERFRPRFGKRRVNSWRGIGLIGSEDNR